MSSHRMPRHLTVTLVLGATVVALLGGCAEPRAASEAGGRRPLVVIGIDGADWGIVRQLWGAGRLPELQRIAEEGVTANLRTAYGASPVIWTTVATGRRPEEHGITGFVVSSPEGDVPVSSTLRRVPALWNMASAGHRSVAVIGWWASWPAEEVRGIVVSDRALLEVDDGIFPNGYRERFVRLVAAARARPSSFGGNPAARDRDRVTAEIAADLLRQPPDLTLAYFRGVDIVSHFQWKHVRPAAFRLGEHAIDPRARNEVFDVYAATDEAIGRMRQVAPDANFVVLSDHGFHAARRPQKRVVLDLDLLLEHLGLLVRSGGRIDADRTLAATHGTAAAENPKRLRLRSPEVRAVVEQRLASVTWAGGQPAFALRPPRPRESDDGVDLVARVLPDGATRTVLADGSRWDDVVAEIVEISGTHGPTTEGIFLAAGPDIDPDAQIDGISIHDIAPTVLYALGLPVGEDFAGEARRTLFTDRFRQARPLRTITTWGTIEPGGARTSAADRALVEELRSLGYLK